MDKKINKTKKSDKPKKVNNDKEYIMPSLIYTFVDEALLAHRERNFMDMFDCIMSLIYNTRTTGIIFKRISSLVYGVEIKDINDNEIKLPAYDIMRYADMHFGASQDSKLDICDNSGKRVSISINSILLANDFIGRVLMISLFEILQERGIELSPELYTTRNVIDYE